MTSPAPSSVPQANMLVYLSEIGPDGYSAPRKLPVLRALEVRGLAEYRGTRARPRVEAWHIATAGQDWLAARRAADRATER